jgi:hypothetical protein
VRRVVARQGLTPALIGLAIGAVATLALARLMQRLLFGVSAVDPLTFAAAALLVSGVALAGAFLPARRAVRCFRNLLLLARSHLIVSNTLMPNLAQIRIAEVKFACNILPHKTLSPSQQHLMTEAPQR